MIHRYATLAYFCVLTPAFAHGPRLDRPIGGFAFLALLVLAVLVMVAIVKVSDKEADALWAKMQAEKLRQQVTPDSFPEFELPINHLTRAIADNDLQKIKTLLTQGFTVNSVDKQGRTPLTMAATQREILRLLLAAGARPDMPDSQKNTALDLAIQAEAADCVKILSAALESKK